MKRIWRSGAVAVIAVALAACAAAGERWGDVTAFDAADGTTVSVSVGQTLAVGLRSAGDGGFDPWTLATTPDRSVLRLVRTGNDRTRNAMPGDFGRDIFVFEAVGAGTTRVVETTVRGWEPESLTTHTLGVVVR